MDGGLQEPKSRVLAFPKHAHRLGYCARGQRLLFQRLGWDYQEFVAHGMDVVVAAKAQDFYVDNVIREAIKDHEL